MFKWIIYLTLLYMTDSVVCKPDYIYNDAVNGWLKFHAVPATWQNAFLQCHYEGAVLASPINPDLESALTQMMKKEDLFGPNGIFIGTNALSSEGDYISIEGVPLADMPVKWRHYNNEQPSKCLYFYDKMVEPIECSTYAPYICYKKRDNSTIFNECGTFDNEYHFSQETGSCYKFHSEFKTWSEAHRICLAEGGHLVIINDQAEATTIKNMLPLGGERVCIGLRQWSKDLWLTIHGEKLENVYHEGISGYDNRYDRSMNGYFFSDGTLNKINLNLESQYICEKDPYTYRFQKESSYNEEE
ncbi:C-type mannose receptor 2 [Helicoverpa armigera]|uniref:C-type mannose receptor 2 n=1 Tax=Helicoverpa armigera TaxID=29058 RepID=UPI003083DA42